MLRIARVTVDVARAGARRLRVRQRRPARPPRGSGGRRGVCGSGGGGGGGRGQALVSHRRAASVLEAYGRPAREGGGGRGAPGGPGCAAWDAAATGCLPEYGQREHDSIKSPAAQRCPSARVHVAW